MDLIDTPALRAVVGQRIRRQRELLDMTQADLARQCFVTQPAVSAWERGQSIPAAHAQWRVAHVLHVPRGELFGPAKAALKCEVCGGSGSELRRTAYGMEAAGTSCGKCGGIGTPKSKGVRS